MRYRSLNEGTSQVGILFLAEFFAIAVKTFFI